MTGLALEPSGATPLAISAHRAQADSGSAAGWEPAGCVPASFPEAATHIALASSHPWAYAHTRESVGISANTKAAVSASA